MKDGFRLSGGTLIFDKRVFAREMLTSSSPIRKLMKSEPDSGLAVQPQIIKDEANKQVIIDYNGSTGITLDEYYEGYFAALKSKYKEKVRGRVTIQVICYSTFHVMLDLNSDDDTIKSIQ